MISGGSAVVVQEQLETLWARRCKRCGWEWPSYLEQCRRCSAVLGDAYGRDVVVFAPELAHDVLAPRFRAVAAVAIELSGPSSRTTALRAKAAGVVAALLDVLAATAAARSVLNGILVAIVANETLAASAAAAARIVSSLPGDADLECRAGIAVGLLDGADAWRAETVTLASRLARAAQPGQTLACRGAVALLEREWQFAPNGPLARRREDIVAGAALLVGLKRPAPTPSALIADLNAHPVERDHELAVLDDALAQVRGGASGWLAVAAPAGGGKSTLLRSWLAHVSIDDVRLVCAACSAFGQSPRALVDQLLAALDSPLSADTADEQVVARLALALDRAGRSRPLLVLIDDLHWADADSLALLAALPAQLPAGCLIIAALRDSFLPAVAWLVTRSRLLRLPPLGPVARHALLERLLPGPDANPLRARLADMQAGGNPLYLEQATALLHDGGPATPLPTSLHEAVLARLHLVLARLSKHGMHRQGPDELAAIERTVGEWLDRLETDDYQDRVAIAGYLGILEKIDAALVIAAIIAGVPVTRNRRLAATIERFYTASFAERADAIIRMAESDRPNAAYAAATGAERAMTAGRGDDATSYLDLAQRLDSGEARIRHLIALGDLLLARSMPRPAWHAFAQAMQCQPATATMRARCERGLAHAALATGHIAVATRLLDRALPALQGGQRLASEVDRAIAAAMAGDAASAWQYAQRWDTESPPAGLDPGELPLARLRLALALQAEPQELESLARQAASTLTFDRDTTTNLAALLDTTLMLLTAAPTLVDPTLIAEARLAARQLVNNAAGSRLATTIPTPG